MIWTRASRSRPCPVPGCRSSSGGEYKRGCEWTTGERTEGTLFVVCINIAEGSLSSHYNSFLGREVYTHIIDASTCQHVFYNESSADDVATSDVKHKTYEALLNGSLAPYHKGYLKTRQMPEEVYKKSCYTSISKEWDKRDEVAQRIASNVIEPLGVPGFWVGRHNEFKLGGPPGIAIPVRRIDGQIGGCQVNTQNAIEAYFQFTSKGIPIPEDMKYKVKGKYIWLSSTPEIRSNDEITYIVKKHGASIKPFLHHPIVRDREDAQPNKFCIDYLDKPAESFLIVEGILKSDVVDYLWPRDDLVRGTPGGSACLGEIARLAGTAGRLTLAPDIDWAENFSVQQSIIAQIERIKVWTPDLCNITLLYWNHSFGKGLDDCLLMRQYDNIKEIPAVEWLNNTEKYRNEVLA